jgi:hypothetical protein
MKLIQQVNEALMRNGKYRHHPVIPAPAKAGINFGRDPFKYPSELRLLAWMDPRLRGDDENTRHHH